jgi:hypothetical protein
MIKQIDRSKGKFYKILLGSKRRIFIASIIATIFLGLLAILILNYTTHIKVSKSISNLQKELIAQGIPNQEKRTYCFTPELFYGPGNNTCYVGVGKKYEPTKSEIALKQVEQYKQVLKNSTDFEAIKYIKNPTKDSINPEIFGTIGEPYIHKKTNKGCIFKYYFTQSGSELSFYCEDDYIYNSWLK